MPDTLGKVGSDIREVRGIIKVSPSGPDKFFPLKERRQKNEFLHDPFKGTECL